ncbi:hypothetical protein BDV96DRAFT_659992 [Lophiotrema nucula]|uniref:Uncharacterized protein n=1 Tax=Lophiotrema nucula TaxID=690887 RepID=A0A6A5Z840_9PLEO|nr:hypothetical protein BDV96DRAFT_659992 [Lophiotrema nucula]
MFVSNTFILLSSLALGALSTPTPSLAARSQGKSLQIVAHEVAPDQLQYRFYVWPQGTSVDVCNTSPIDAVGGFIDNVEDDINNAPFIMDEVSGKFDGGDCKYSSNIIDNPGELSCASWGKDVKIDCAAEAEKGHVTHDDCWNDEKYQRVIKCEW